MNKFKNKLLISFVIVIIFFSNVSITTNAQCLDAFRNDSDKVISIREDVPSDVARKDKTYDNFISKKNFSKNSIMVNSENVRWDIAGHRLYKNEEHLMAAYGYSAHMKGDVILDTYHYTRVYFGISKVGDSDRVWGKGKVCATGPWVDWDVASNSTLYVKYGTESN